MRVSERLSMKRVTAPNGVVYYTSDIIPCPHGFSTRHGGVSLLPHTASLNLGVNRDDPDSTVIENLKLFSNAVGIDYKTVISATQIHSDIIREVNACNGGEGYLYPTKTACDGYFTEDSGVSLGVRTADCVPILMYAKRNDGGEMISAVHAGWRGTLAKISVKAAKELCKKASIEEIRVAIGPCIRSCCYEVDQSFYEAFVNGIGREAADAFILPSAKQRHYMADIAGINKWLLMQIGIPKENIDSAELCTCCEPSEFYSHRYAGEKRGTMLSIISLNRGGKNNDCQR